MTDVAAACAELATLWAALPDALARDNTATGHGRSWIPAGVVNADVLHAQETLRTEVPRAHRTACDALGDRWVYRDINKSLIALPVLSERLTGTSQPQAAASLAHLIRRWVHVTKVAIGLRYPDDELRTDDKPDGWRCPYAPIEQDIHEHTQPILITTGREGFLNHDAEGWTVTWVCTSQIYCPLCGRTWAPPEWLRLGRILEREQANA